MARKKKYKSHNVKKIKNSANFCFYCFRSIITAINERGHQPVNSRTIDHFIPLDKGGNNFQYNMVICCYLCNSTKGNLLPGEFNSKISLLWQSNNHFKYTKQELRNIIAQIKHIRKVYDQNMVRNKPYYLIELPRKMGLLEQLRFKHKTYELPLSNYQYRETAQC